MAHAAPTGPRIEPEGLRLGEQLIPLYSGAVHYFRLAPGEWAGALSGVRDLGLHLVETYVPWAAHERAPGEFDFGEHDPQLHLDRFLKLAQDVGLRVFVRPGPHINAELTGFGLPERVTADPDCRAQSAAGGPVPMVAPPRSFAVPSYASRAFATEVAAWYRAVGAVLRPHLWPNGPVVLVQVDNEAVYYFRDGPYDQDYHPDAVRHYQALLTARYGSVEAINRAHGGQAAELQKCDPPRRFDGSSRQALRRQLDWAEAREQLLQDALTGMRDELAAAGFKGLKTVHNLPLGDAGAPAGLGRLQRVVDVAGNDFYECSHQLRTVKRRTLRMVGSGSLPFAPELGVGGPPWLNPRDRADTLAVALCALAYGLRGFNLYMAVERDRWYGAALTRSGARTATGRQLRTLMRNLEKVSFHRLQRRVRVGLMVPAEYARLSRATHTLGFVSPLVADALGLGPEAACRQDEFGFAAPIQLAHARWIARAEALLDREAVPYVYLDSQRPPSAWSHLDVVLSPTFEFACPNRMEALAQFESRGGTVISGPHAPHLDAQLRAQAHPKLSGLRCDLSDAEAATERAVLAALPASCEPERDWQSDLPDVETTVHRAPAATGSDPAGPPDRVAVLFATNFGPLNARPRLSLPAPSRLTDAITGQVYEGAEQVTLTLSPHSCRMFIVAPPEKPTGAGR